MSKYLIGILLILLSLTESTTIKKSRCVAYGGDCDGTSYCCSGMVCKDYRCAVKGTKDNQVAWAPKGTKCDYFHHCPKYYHCESHYCVVSRNKVVNAISKSLKRDY